MISSFVTPFDFCLSILKQHLKTRVERVGDTIKGFQPQLRHLQIPKKTEREGFGVFAKVKRGWLSQIDQEYYFDFCGCLSNVLILKATPTAVGPSLSRSAVASS